MKKLSLLILLFTLCVSHLQAQDFKGRVSLGLGLSTQTLDDKEVIGTSQVNKGWSLNPSIGYFINNKWRIGLKGNFLNSSVEQSGASFFLSNSNINWGVGAFATYHHWFSPKWAFLVESSLGYNHKKFMYAFNSTNVQQNRLEDGTTEDIQLNANIGVLFMLGKKFGIEIQTNVLGLRYSFSDSITFNQDSSQLTPRKQTSFSTSLAGGNGINLLNNLTLGLKLFF